MSEGAASPLRAWESFYVIVGSAGGALTGLQFVVLTLIGEAGMITGNKDAISAFGSPNIVHFCAALLVSSILSAPWTSMGQVGIAVAACGVLGVVYSLIVLRRTFRQRAYRPVLEDWVWHIILPIFAYSTLFVTGAILERSPAETLFVVGGAVVLLVFIGIHNAWDTVMYVTLARLAAGRQADASAGTGTPARTSTKGERGSDRSSPSAVSAGAPPALPAPALPPDPEGEVGPAIPPVAP